MIISGWAYTTNESEIREKYSERYQEIAHLAESLKIKKDSQYARVKFSGVLESPEAQALSELDLALIADQGNLCFGGQCERNGDTFTGSYNTD